MDISVLFLLQNGVLQKQCDSKPWGGPGITIELRSNPQFRLAFPEQDIQTVWT